MSRAQGYSGNFDDVMNFDGRNGAIQTVPLHATQRVNVRKQRRLLRSLLIDQHCKECRERMREFSRTDLSATPRVVALAFGHTLRFYRERLGYTQHELADIAGFDHTYPSLLERGLRIPSVAVIVPLACALNIAPVELYRSFLDTLRMRANSAATAA